jgi:hypothetical protein
LNDSSLVPVIYSFASLIEYIITKQGFLRDCLLLLKYGSTKLFAFICNAQIELAHEAAFGLKDGFITCILVKSTFNIFLAFDRRSCGAGHIRAGFRSFNAERRRRRSLPCKQVVHAHLGYPILLKPAVLFEILPSLVVLFEALLRSSSFPNPIQNWTNIILGNAVCCWLAKCIPNNRAWARCSLSPAKALDWQGSR